MSIAGKTTGVKLEYYPDKSFEAGPDRLFDWQKSGRYVCQQKVDGHRYELIRVEDGFVAISRHNNVKESGRFCSKFEPALRALLDYLPVGTVLDGEWFGPREVDAQRRLGLEHHYYVFDVISWGATPQINKAYSQRLAILADLFSRYSAPGISLVDSALEGADWEEYYKSQEAPISEGVVVKALASKMKASPKKSEKNPQHFKVKFRGGADGNSSLDQIRAIFAEHDRSAS